MNRLLIYSLLTVGLLIGCGQGGSTSSGPAPKPSLAAAKIPGWTEAKTSGIAVSFPSGWKVLDPMGPDFNKGLDEMAKEPGSLGKFTEQARNMAKDGTFKLIAIDPKSASADNVNVILKDVPGSPTLQQMADAMKQGIEPSLAPGTQVQVTPEAVPAGDLIKIRAEVAVSGTPMVSTVCIMLHNNQLLAMTFTTTKANLDKFDPTIEQCIKSVRFD